MTPGRDAFAEQRLHFLAESDLVDEELDLMCLGCSTSSIVQQEVTCMRITSACGLADTGIVSLRQTAQAG